MQQPVEGGFVRSPIEESCMQTTILEGLYATPSKKYHEEGMPLGKENFISSGPFRIHQNALYQS